MSLRCTGQDRFHSKCAGTHRGDPPWESGRQAGAADGQCNTKASRSGSITAGEWIQWGPISFDLIHILIGPPLCASHAHYAGPSGEHRGWPEGRENRDKKNLGFPILRELTVFSGTVTGTMATAPSSTVVLVTVSAPRYIPMSQAPYKACLMYVSLNACGKQPVKWPLFPFYR